MSFELNSSGTLLYQNETLSLSSAERAIKSAVFFHPNLALVLSVDPEAPWQGVVSFVELAQNLQVDSFSFAIRDKAGSSL
jgi:biopolymer transport protein ExbD